MTPATSPGDGEPHTLPMRPTLLGLQVDHLEKDSQPVTVIMRRFDEPRLCRLCPKCDHDSGFCRVIAPGHLPAASCAGYVLPALPPERKAGFGVQ